MLKFAAAAPLSIFVDATEVAARATQAARTQWAAWQAGRRLAREEARSWDAALQEARWMANQARAMSAMAKGAKQ